MVKRSKSKNIVIVGGIDPESGEQKILNHPEMNGYKYKVRQVSSKIGEDEYRDGVFSYVDELRPLIDMGHVRPKLDFVIAKKDGSYSGKLDVHRIQAPKNYRNPECPNRAEYMRHAGVAFWPYPMNGECYIDNEKYFLDELKRTAYVRGIHVDQSLIRDNLVSSQQAFDDERKGKSTTMPMLRRIQSVFWKDDDESRYLPKNYLMFGEGQRLDSIKEAVDYWNEELYGVPAK